MFSGKKKGREWDYYGACFVFVFDGMQYLGGCLLYSFVSDSY